MKQQSDSRKATQAPLYHAYSVKEAAGDRARAHWTKIGAFFQHEDGQGGTLVLDALPIGNRIVLRTSKADDTMGGAQ